MEILPVVIAPIDLPNDLGSEFAWEIRERGWASVITTGAHHKLQVELALEHGATVLLFWDFSEADLALVRMHRSSPICFFIGTSPSAEGIVTRTFPYSIKMATVFAEIAVVTGRGARLSALPT